jgi:hypothetical protein
VTVSFENVDARDALKTLFEMVDISYSIAPGVAGKVVFSAKDVPFETALRGVLDQACATWRVDSGIYNVVSRYDPDIPGEPVFRRRKDMPDFRPGRYTGACHVVDKSLYLAADRSWGGTSDLLVSAVRRAGYREWFAYAYGAGFALVLPPEAIDEDGTPWPGAARFAFRADMADRDFRKVGELFRGSGEHPAPAYRVLVLVVGPSAVKPRRSPTMKRWCRSASNTGLPDAARPTEWLTDPLLTVLVYEFRRSGAEAEPELRPSRELGLSAKAHVAASGLWKSSDLR